MTLTHIQAIIIICMVALGTVITRFLSVILFRDAKTKNSYINYLGRVLPYAAVGLLVVYCLKNVNFTGPAYGIPEFIAIICIAVLHYWKGNVLLSIGIGTFVYMILVQVVFV